MTFEQLMKMHKTRSELYELTTEERQRYDDFLLLGESDRDGEILSVAFLKHHAMSTR